MSATGKTVARIEEAPVGEYGPDHASVVIRFTDGTALKVGGSSYEEVTQNVTPLSLADVREMQRQTMGYREQQWMERLLREEWLSISCEERGERKRAREAKKNPMALLMRDEFAGAMVEQMYAANRLLFGPQPERRVRQPCENCGERLCPNAPVKVIPAQKGIPVGSTFSVQIGPGSLTEAPGSGSAG